MHRFREPLSGFTHLGGVVFGVFALIVLVGLTHNDFGKLIAVICYSMSMILLYAASTTLHLVNGSERVLLWLRRFDHATIYLVIAGTYTPFVYFYLTGMWRASVLGILWAIAVMGVVYKLCCLENKTYISSLLYVGMGWFALLLTPQIVKLVPPGAIGLLLLGGLIYTLGAVIFAIERPNLHRYFGHHELWHVFTLGGSAVHFLAVYLYIA
jgi:hemolysin III